MLRQSTNGCVGIHYTLFSLTISVRKLGVFLIEVSIKYLKQGLPNTCNATYLYYVTQASVFLFFFFGPVFNHLGQRGRPQEDC